MTLGEKIIARHWVVDPAKGTIGVPAVKPGDEGFVVTDVRFSHEYVTPMAAIFFEQLVGPDEKVLDPGSILMFRDHLTFLGDAMTPERVKEGLLDVALELEKKQRAFAQKQGIRLYGELRLGHHGSEAICHSKILEGHAEPGMVIIGSDSHTPHAGAVGCVAFGVGTTAIFNSWITKDVRLTVPETVRVVVRGEKPTNVTAKDFMLEILRHPYVKSCPGEAALTREAGGPEAAPAGRGPRPTRPRRGSRAHADRGRRRRWRRRVRHRQGCRERIGCRSPPLPPPARARWRQRWWRCGQRRWQWR